MNKIEIQGMGVFCEIYKRKDTLTEIEVLREAGKAITREIIRRESRESNIDNSTNRPTNSDLV